MDPNLLRHIEYFLEPNQTGDLDDQQQRGVDPASATSSNSHNFWDAAGLNMDSALASPPTPTNLSYEALGPSTPSTSKASAALRSQQPPGQGSRVILAPRPQKSKAGHERKRTKLSTESTPFDNVDYWIQFDNDEGAAAAAAAEAAAEADSPELSHQKHKVKGSQQQQQSRETQQQPLQGSPQPQPQQQQRQQLQQQQRPKAQHTKSSPSSLPTSRDHQRRRARTHGSSRSAAAGPSSSRPIHRSFRPEDLLEDEALDYALSEEGDVTAEDFGSINLADHMSGIDFVPPPDVPPREGLYSTPLSWEKPQPGLRLDSLMSMQNPQQLNQDEQRRLIAIAMGNTGPAMGGLGPDQFGQSSGSRGYVPGGGLHATLGSGINLAALGGFGGGFGGFGGFGGLGGLGPMSQITDDAPLLRPETPSVAKEPQARSSRQSSNRPEGKGKGKEKETHDDDDEDDDSKESKGKGKTGDRTAHNDIERKYRTNLKDKIAELRDAVPALRTIQEGMIDDGDESVPGNRPKVSKGTVLTKATEYISHLEKKNQAILAQHQQLSRRLAAFEQLLSQTARPTFQMPNYSRTLFDPRAFC